jgi:hypothetical protein
MLFENQLNCCEVRKLDDDDDDDSLSVNNSVVKLVMRYEESRPTVFDCSPTKLWFKSSYWKGYVRFYFRVFFLCRYKTSMG